MGFIQRSTVGGTSWQEVLNSQVFLNTTEKVYVHFVEVAPSNPNVVYALASIQYYHQGILLISSDGGDTWRISNTKVDGHGASMAVDPQDANTLYVGTWYDGVYRSQDGGNSFEAINSGLPSTSFPFYALAVDPVDTDRVYLGTNSSVFFSSDKGGHWMKLAKDPIPGNDIWTDGVGTISIDPHHPGYVYVCAKGDAYRLLGWDPENPQ